MEKDKLLGKGIGVVTTVYSSKGYGFIQQEDETSIFFHANGVCTPDFKDLKEGYSVEYLIVDSPKGKRAIGVVVI